MKPLADSDWLLSEGFARLRERFAVPEEFAPEVIAEVERMASRVPDAHADWTGRGFVTLDPATSTDLDQAFVIEPAGADLLFHYALADIAGSCRRAGRWRRKPGSVMSRSIFPTERRGSIRRC